MFLNQPTSAARLAAGRAFHLFGFQGGAMTACLCLTMAVFLGAPVDAGAQNYASHGVGGAKPFIHVEFQWEGDVDKLAHRGIKVNKFPWPESYRGMASYQPMDKGRGSNDFDTDPSLARSKFDATEIGPQLHQLFGRRLNRQGVGLATSDQRETRVDVPHLSCKVKIEEKSGGRWSWSVSATASGWVRHITRDEIFSAELWNSVGKYQVTRGDTMADSLKASISKGVEHVADEFADAAKGAGRADDPFAPSTQGGTAQFYPVPQAAIVQARQRIRPLLIQLKISVEPRRVRLPYFKGVPVNYVFFFIPTATSGNPTHFIAVGSNGRVYTTRPERGSITNLLQQILTVSSKRDAMRYGYIHTTLIRARNAKELKFGKVGYKVTTTSAGGYRLRARMPITASTVSNDDRTAFALDLQFNTSGKLDRRPSWYTFVKD